MIELTLLNGDVIHINPAIIDVFRTESTGSEIETNDWENYHVKESILEIMQKIIDFRAGGEK